MRSILRWLGLAVLACTIPPPAWAQFPPAPGTGPGLAETIEAIDSARVTTRILYVTAHPDDESAALLTYLARGLHADVALLTLTRGEGGQNALGPEQAPQFGLIRTQELLAATRGYGVKLFFTRAPDFGYSKTSEETMRIWGDQVLGDMVRVIRTFQPNIVINGWGGVSGGHGHHQTSGLWTPRAVKLAADGKAFPEQLQQGLLPWGNEGKPVVLLDTERGGVKDGYTVPVDEISPLWGKSYREIALDAFVNHRSQGATGFVGSPFLRRPITLASEDGSKFDPTTLAQPLEALFCGRGDTKCSFCSVFCNISKEIEEKIGSARAAALALDWQKASQYLADAEAEFGSFRVLGVTNVHGSGPQLPPRWSSGDFQLNELYDAQDRLRRARVLAAGFRVIAEADRSELVLDEPFHVSVRAICRTEVRCSLRDPEIALPPTMGNSERSGDPSRGFDFTITLKKATPTRLAWEGSWPVESTDAEWTMLHPETPPLIYVVQDAMIKGYLSEIIEPVMHIQASTTRLNQVVPRIVPAYTLAVEPVQEIEALVGQHKPFDVLLRVHSYATKPGKVDVGLDVPSGWTVSAPVETAFDGGGDRYVKLSVTPPERLVTGEYTISAYAKCGDEKFTTSLEPLPSLPTQLWSEPAECRVHAFDVRVPENLRVGYITAESEPVPEAIQRLGIQVELLDPAALNFGDLSKYDAIVVGVRAYELRSDLAPANQRLLDYVSNGGTLVVQYQRDFAWDKFRYAPYPAKIGSPTPRITDENAAVTFLQPEDALLNRPNKITQDDFKGWVQERGLYYWGQFDPRYTPLLAMHDPGEDDLNGGLVYAHFGKGTYIYTGLAFFRQLPEGVSGAYRLLVNLLSASRPQ